MENKTTANNIIKIDADTEGASGRAILTLATGEKIRSGIVYRRYEESDGMQVRYIKSSIGSSCPPCSSSESIKSQRFTLPFGLEFVTCLCGKHYVLRAHYSNTLKAEIIEIVILLPEKLWVVTDETKIYNESHERES